MLKLDKKITLPAIRVKIHKTRHKVDPLYICSETKYWKGRYENMVRTMEAYRNYMLDRGKEMDDLRKEIHQLKSQNEYLRRTRAVYHINPPTLANYGDYDPSAPPEVTSGE